MDAEGTGRTLVLPGFGVPIPEVAFGLNNLAIEAAQKGDRVRCGIWVSPLARDAERYATALALAAEGGVKAFKASFLLGGSPTDPECRPQLGALFARARELDLVVHVHTSS